MSDCSLGGSRNAEGCVQEGTRVMPLGHEAEVFVYLKFSARFRNSHTERMLQPLA